MEFARNVLRDVELVKTQLHASFALITSYLMLPPTPANQDARADFTLITMVFARLVTPLAAAAHHKHTVRPAQMIDSIALLVNVYFNAHPTPTPMQTEYVNHVIRLVESVWDQLPLIVLLAQQDSTSTTVSVSDSAQTEHTPILDHATNVSEDVELARMLSTVPLVPLDSFKDPSVLTLHNNVEMDTMEILQPNNACHATHHVLAVLETLLINVKLVLTDINLLEPLVLLDVSQDTT